MTLKLVCFSSSLNFEQTDLFRAETLDKSENHGAEKVRQGVEAGGLWVALTCKGAIKGYFMVIRTRSEGSKCAISSRVSNMELRGEDPHLDTGTNKLSVLGYIFEPSEPHFYLSLLCNMRLYSMTRKGRAFGMFRKRGIRAEF